MTSPFHSQAVRLQYLLYFLRFLSLCFILPFCLFFPPVLSFASWITSTCVTGFLIVNDLLLLTWDLYFFGCFLAIAVVQVFISFIIVNFGIWWIAEWNRRVHGRGIVSFAQPDLAFPTLCFMLSMLYSIILIVTTTTRAWVRGPKWAWKLGVKDLACTDSLCCSLTARVSFFGKRRKSNDEVRTCLHIWASLKGVFIRRIPEVETLKFALCRNIMAALLLLILVGEAGRLFIEVISETFKVQDTWDNLQTNVTATQPALKFTNWGGLLTYMSTQDSNSSLSDLLQMPACNDAEGYCYTDTNTSQFISIAIVLDAGTNAPSLPMWLFLSIGRDYHTATDYDFYLAQYATPMRLVAGSHTFGLLELVEYRGIKSSIWDMIGFKPSYFPFAMISIKSAGQVPLGNNSIAQATLQWERNFNDGVCQYPIIQQYRQHTFLSALSSVGGLLAILQGFHLLLFGRPLWWGLFGAKALNPFGMFGAVSSDIREKMITRYGYIPNPSVEGDSGAHKLGLFLSDFVLDVGPLYQHEEGNIHSAASAGHLLTPSQLRRRSDESAEASNDMEMLRLQSEWNRAGKNTSE